MLIGGWKGLGGGTGEVELPVIKHEIQHGPRQLLSTEEENQDHSKGSGQRRKHFNGRRLTAKPLHHNFLQDPRM